MSLFKDRAVTLRRVDYSETSQVLVMFTQTHGKQRLIAKGIKRSTKTRAAAGIDLLEEGQAVWSRREGSDAALGILTDWRQLDAFTGLRRQLDRMYSAQYAAEITASLMEEDDPHPELYARMLDALAALVDGDSALSTVVDYQRDVLTAIGQLPTFARCVVCGRSITGRKGVYLSSSEGGLLCPECEPSYVEKRRVASEAVAGWNGSPWTQAGRIDAFDALDYHITCILNRPTRLAAFVRSAVAASSKKPT